MTDSRIPADLLERHLAGDVTPEEAAVVAEWIEQRPGAREFLRATEAAISPVQQNADQHWHALRQKMDTAKQAKPRAGGRYRWIYQSGSVGVALVLIVMLLGPRTSSDATVYATVRSEHVTITLPDSSTVTLAPETRLTVSDKFGHRDRSVTLSGEAYFHVTPSAELPFQIRTATIVTRVLGTAFGVRHYDGDAATRVAVQSGKVASGGTASYMVLSAGAVAFVTDSTATQLPAAEVRNYTSWVDGRLTFSDTPIPEMLVTMGRWYGYTFELADSALAKRHVTATFNVHASQETLAEMARLLNVTMRREGVVITLAPRSKPSQARDNQVDRIKLSPRLQPGDQAANTLPGQVGR